MWVILKSAPELDRWYNIMATALTAIFGSNINVYQQPIRSVRQYAGFAGAHGLAGMHLGTRGRQLVISGHLAVTVAGYNAARAAMQTAVNAIEAWLLADPADYSFAGVTYYAVVLDKLELIPDGNGKVFHWAVGNRLICKFTCWGTSIL